MRTCPYCGKEAMSFSRKAQLGPVRTAKCQFCGKRVSVSPLSFFGLAAFFLGIIAPIFVGLPLGIAAFVVGAVVMFVIHEAVPLVGRDS